MVYGDGDGVIFERFTKSLDVVGHELTHGVHAIRGCPRLPRPARCPQRIILRCVRFVDQTMETQADRRQSRLADRRRLVCQGVNGSAFAP